MFQDLPPVKGEVELSSLPLAPVQRFRSKEVEVEPLAPLACRSRLVVARSRKRRGRALRRRQSRRHAARREPTACMPEPTCASRCRSRFPKGFHVQSNKPRDPTLIPDRADGRRPGGRDGGRSRLSGTCRPETGGRRQPLAVFEQQLRDRRARWRSRTRARPARSTCRRAFAIRPATTPLLRADRPANAEWTLRVVPASTADDRRFTAMCSIAIAFGRGEAPGNSRSSPTVAFATNRRAETVTSPSLDGFTVLGARPAATWAATSFSEFSPQRRDRRAKSAACSKDAVRSRSCCIVFRRRPGAESHAVRAADDSRSTSPSSAPARRRARAAAASCSAAPTAPRWRVVYGVLGLIVILTAGTFGTINASPWFNLGIAVLFVALALAMFDVITIDFSRFSSGMRFGDAGRGTFVLAFTMGGVAALLAGACVAPVVIQVVLFSSNLYAKGNGRRARAAVPAWRRHGDAVADRRRRPRGAAEAGRVDGPRQAGLRRRHPGDGRSTTATKRTASSRTGGSMPPRCRRAWTRQVKAGWHRSLAEGLDAADARRQARADRHVGDVVQELPDDGQDDAGGSGGDDGARAAT